MDQTHKIVTAHELKEAQSTGTYASHIGFIHQTEKRKILSIPKPFNKYKFLKNPSLSGMPGQLVCNEYLIKTQ